MKMIKIALICFCFLVLVTGIILITLHKKEKTKNTFSDNKIAYLTFDDGPSEYTEDLLDILKERNVPAIFFVVGRHIEEIGNSHDILKRVYAENHHIGLHSITHNRENLYSKTNSPKIFINEMKELQNQLDKILNGYKTALLRAPFGSHKFSKQHWKALKKAKFYHLDWNIESRDWELQSADEIYEQVVNSVESMQFPQTLVLVFHEYQRTVDILPSVIDYFHENGYTFVPYVAGEKIDVGQKEPPSWIRSKAYSVKKKIQRIL